MAWLWLSIPLAAVFFGAWSGVPLQMVLRHPSWARSPPMVTAEGLPGQSRHRPVTAAGCWPA